MALIKKLAFVNGGWINADNGKVFDVINPGDGSILASVADVGAAETQRAITAAHEAFQSWKKTTPRERYQLLIALFKVLSENIQELTGLLSKETGKPIAEATGEIFMANAYLEFYAEEAKRGYGEVFPNAMSDNNIIALRQPIGVAALIFPWNFPYAMALRSAAAAIAAGCTCVIKPAEDTPLSTLALAHFVEKVGFPPGVFNVVTCDRPNAPTVGKALCESPLVAGLSFTGSTQVGKILNEQCAKTVKRVSLELGGNAPFVVFPSADLEKTIQGLMFMKFMNCGQACISPNRLFVHKSRIEEFIQKLTHTIKTSIVLGPATKPDVTTGPLANKAQVLKVSGLVDDAVAKGAQVVIGGKRATTIGEYFYEPTILTNVKEGMAIYREEIFGPVVQIFPFDTEDEVLTMANDTPRGLAGYVYSENMSEIFRFAKQLDVGLVGVNDTNVGCIEAPFGGVKESGFGKAGSKHGMDEFTYIKALTISHL